MKILTSFSFFLFYTHHRCNHQRDDNQRNHGEFTPPVAGCDRGVHGILPDVDHPQNYMGRLCPPIRALLYRKVDHRTLTHSIFGWAMAAILFLPFKGIKIDSDL